MIRCFNIHQAKKAEIGSVFDAPGTVGKVTQHMEYVKALKQQNKTFNQNGKYPAIMAVSDL